MNYNHLIQKVYTKIEAVAPQGEVASYIPELSKINPNKFGVHISTTQNFNFGLGDYQEKFSIQSVSKVISLCLAYKILGETIWKRVDVEPSGTKFNSLLQLEADNGIPRNPFINAGALVICDMLISNLENPEEDLLAFIANLSDHKVEFSLKIAASEKLTGYRNVALCNFIKSLGNIDNEPEVVLDFYFKLCSLEASCEELSQLFLFLANKGKTLHSNLEILTKSQTKRVNAIMQTCGFYDESGEFSFRVGIPGKSGVGGGIMAIHPGKYSIVTWSPKLNEKGNSYKGMRFLEDFTTLTEQSIF